MSETGMDENVWTAPRRALWQRLHQYEFGGEHHEAFLTRVAHACQTTREGAQAALEEYRRFCFLAISAGHPVTPSELIDQVWHAHMTDTRDYWQRFCPQVLEQSLHHAPSLGGTQEQERHQQQYRETYISYERFFGDPPAAQWPYPALSRAAQAATHEPQSGRRTPLRFVTPWTLPPRGVGRWAWIWSGACAAAYVWGVSVSADYDPLQWRGYQFLAFYIAAIGCVFTVGGALERRVRGANRRGSVQGGDPVELGFLAAGTERAADVAIVELLDRDALRLDFAGHARDAARTGAWLRANPDGGKQPLPESLREAMWIVQRRQNLDDALGALKQHYAGLGEHLQRKGWWMSSGQALGARLVGTLPIVALVGFGLCKIFIGVERGKPVGFLVVLTAFAGVLALVRWAFAKRRSRAGDWALHDADRALAKRRESSDVEAGARVALMGTAGLLDSALADYHILRTPVSSSSDGSGGSSSCGSSSNSSSNSSDSGGSSCGSSGCGGCGGGGD